MFWPEKRPSRHFPLLISSVWSSFRFHFVFYVSALHPPSHRPIHAIVLSVILGAIQLALEIGECNAESVLVRVDERHKHTGNYQWAIEKNNVCHGAVFHHDVHDIGTLTKTC